MITGMPCYCRMTCKMTGCRGPGVNFPPHRDDPVSAPTVIRSMHRSSLTVHQNSRTSHGSIHQRFAHRLRIILQPASVRRRNHATQPEMHGGSCCQPLPLDPNRSNRYNLLCLTSHERFAARWGAVRQSNHRHATPSITTSKCVTPSHCASWCSDSSEAWGWWERARARNDTLAHDHSAK